MSSLRTYVKTNRVLRAGLFLAQNAWHALRSVLPAGAGTPASGGDAEHDLAAMVRVKDEARFLPEWLAHHVRVGVEHVYVYDNNSSDDLAGAVGPFVERGMVTVIPWPTEPASPSAHIDFLERFGRCARWTLFFDADEFLIEREPGQLLRFLDSHERWPAVALNSRYFGTAGLVQMPDGLVTVAFDRAEAGMNDHVKVIARPSAIVRYRNPHSFYYRRGRLARTPDGRRVFGTFVRTPGEPDLRLHHYLNRSREDFENKRVRGYATEAGARNQQRRAEWAEVELAKFNDVPAGVPDAITGATAELMRELGFPAELWSSVADAGAPGGRGARRPSPDRDPWGAGDGKNTIA